MRGPPFGKPLSLLRAYAFLRPCASTKCDGDQTPLEALVQVLAVGRRMRCIQRLDLLRRERQRERYGVLLYMRHRTRFGNCNHVTTADGPGQRNSGCRATMCCADTRKHGIAQHAGAGPAERRISHHRHAVLFAPWQQVMFNAPVDDAVRDLIGRATIALWNSEEIFHLTDCEVGDAPGTNLARRAQVFKPDHYSTEISVFGPGQCSK